MVFFGFLNFLFFGDISSKRFLLLGDGFPEDVGTKAGVVVEVVEFVGCFDQLAFRAAHLVRPRHRLLQSFLALFIARFTCLALGRVFLIATQTVLFVFGEDDFEWRLGVGWQKAVIPAFLEEYFWGLFV
jgi:hypothetical protein